jgi:hypothetical protein
LLAQAAHLSRVVEALSTFPESCDAGAGQRIGRLAVTSVIRSFDEEMSDEEMSIAQATVVVSARFAFQLTALDTATSRVLTVITGAVF